MFTIPAKNENFIRDIIIDSNKHHGSLFQKMNHNWKKNLYITILLLKRCSMHTLDYQETRMTTIIKAQLKISDGQMNIDKNRKITHKI